MTGQSRYHLAGRSVPETEEPGFVCPAGHEDSPTFRHQDWHSLVGHSHLPHWPDCPSDQQEQEEEQSHCSPL